MNEHPNKQYKRRLRGGGKALLVRQIIEGIVYVLRICCQWKALPKKRFGGPTATHRYFLEWAQAGFFLALWKAGLVDYDELQGTAWGWQCIDGAMTKAPLA